MADIKALLTKKYGGLPGYAWGLVAIGGIVVGLYFYNRSKTAKAPTTTNTTPAAATSADSGSTGYGNYAPVGSNAGGTGTPSTTINVGVPAQNPSNWLTTLNLTSNGAIPLYATSGSAGDTTLPQVLAQIPGGTTITATGPELVGAWAPTVSGSELWYPVVYNGQAGFVSAYYVANASSTIQNGPVPPPTTNPPGDTGISVKTRARGTGDVGWDKSQNGLPWVDTNGKSLPHIPFDQSITIASKTPDSNGNLTATYLGQTGLIHSWDVVPG